MTEWISVKDRLPEPHMWVLVGTTTPNRWMMAFRNLDEDIQSGYEYYLWNIWDGWGCDPTTRCPVEMGGVGELTLEEITHWMPIPLLAEE